MTTKTQFEADRIDCELARVEGAAETAGMDDLRTAIAKARTLARAELTDAQRKAAPF